MTREVKFGDWLNQAFELYKANFGVLVLTSLLAGLISSVTVGILMAPMMAGMVLIVLRLLRGQTPKPDVSTLFEGFNHFLPALLLFVVWGVLIFGGTLLIGWIPCIGRVLPAVAGLVLGALLMFALFLIVDRGMDFWPASMASIAAVKPAFGPLLGYSIVISLLGQIGVLACGIGLIFTLPIYFCGLAVAYEQYMREETPATPPADMSPPPEPPPASVV